MFFQKLRFRVIAKPAVAFGLDLVWMMSCLGKGKAEVLSGNWIMHGMSQACGAGLAAVAFWHFWHEKEVMKLGDLHLYGVGAGGPGPRKQLLLQQEENSGSDSERRLPGDKDTLFTITERQDEGQYEKNDDEFEKEKDIMLEKQKY